MYKLIKEENSARRAEFVTNRGTVQTPAFMNVATCGAIKGAVSAEDLKTLGCQVMLSNTYHLHIRPGDEVVKECGGLHKFSTWDGPILTDSGGFQVFSLSSLRKIEEEGVTFASHIDGKRIFMGPEESMQIQSNLGSTIAMAFDECVENPAEYAYLALYAMQHRGQQSCGIAVSNDGVIDCEKGMGLVSEVFSEDKLAKLSGQNITAHVLYSAKGASNIQSAQPIVMRYGKGRLCVATNGVAFFGASPFETHFFVGGLYE